MEMNMKQLILTFLILSLMGCGDWTYSRTIEGEVVNTGSRLKATDTGAQQKVSLVVKTTKSDPKVEDVAGGPSGVAVECLSTRCASISVGTCHRFQCKHEYRFNEPDVISCKHDKEIACTSKTE
jgi:hypothetical protein